MKRVILLGIIFLMFISISYAQSTVIEGDTAGGTDRVFTSSRYDSDGDGICDEPSNIYRDGGVRSIDLGCTATILGDLCAGTPSGEVASRRGDDSGCSPSQTAGFSNYWGIRIDTNDARPRVVEPNWLTDQRQGVKVYQPISFFRNTFNVLENEDIEFRGATVYCTNDRGVIRTKEIGVGDLVFDSGQNGGELNVQSRNGVTYIEGSYGSVSLSGVGNTDMNRTLEIRLNYQSDESLVRPKDIRNYKGEYGIDEIEFECTARINQCRRLIKDENGVRVRSNNCIPIYPPEEEEFPLIISLDSLAYKPPEAFLIAGMESADKVLDFTEALEPKLRNLYEFLRGNCLGAISIVLGGKIFSFIPGVDDAVNFIWFGPEELRNFGLYKESFIISGRSMCSAVACPRDWCRPLNWHPKEGSKSLAELTIGKDLITGQPSPKPIQDSLFLSTTCGCVSGMLAKLYQIEAIALQWKTCLLEAKTTGQYVGECDRVLSNGVCTFIIDELQYVGKFDFGSFFGFNSNTNEPKKSSGEEAVEAGGILRNNFIIKGLNSGTRNAREFAKNEVAVLGSADIKGNLGYQSHLLASTLCSLALYRDFPNFNSLQSSELANAPIKTTTSSNFNYKVAFFGEGGVPVYGYDISWMVVSGRESLRYDVYLESDQGSRRPIHSDVLRNIGDFNSDFIQVTDELEYTKLCFDLKEGVSRIRCYPPGKGSTGGINEDLELFKEGVKDSDNDRLPDDWEIRFSCYQNRGEFSNAQDEKACKDLLQAGKSNVLDPLNSNTDGGRVNDGSEDPDGDKFNNYQEYLENTHPNIANGKLDGSVLDTRSSCYASFGGIRLVGGDILEGVQGLDRIYIPGETISVGVDSLNVLSGTVNVNTEDLLVLVEITGGPRSTYEGPFEIPYSQAVSGVTFGVWEIPEANDAPISGVYDLTVQLVVPEGLIGYDICRDEEGVLSEVTKKIVIYNEVKERCIDSDDRDDFRIGGICIDAAGVAGVHKDSCNENVASDFECRDGSCVSSTLNCQLDGRTCLSGACVSG